MHVIIPLASCTISLLPHHPNEYHLYGNQSCKSSTNPNHVHNSEPEYNIARYCTLSSSNKRSNQTLFSVKKAIYVHNNLDRKHELHLNAWYWFFSYNKANSFICRKYSIFCGIPLRQDLSKRFV